jgi:hypothetical protein
MTDYRINLAKDMTGTAEQRRTFYCRMLLYQAICAVALVYVIYISGDKLVDAYYDNELRRMIGQTMESSSDEGREFYRNPKEVYNSLNRYSREIDGLRAALGKQISLLPVMNAVLAGTPSDVALQNLAASSSKHIMTFALAVPIHGSGNGETVRNMQAAWQKDEYLKAHLDGSIREVKRARGSWGGIPVFHVHFECSLKQ